MFIAAIFKIAKKLMSISNLLAKGHVVCMHKMTLFGHKKKQNHNIKMEKEVEVIMLSKICQTKKTNIACLIPCTDSRYKCMCLCACRQLKAQRGKKVIGKRKWWSPCVRKADEKTSRRGRKHKQEQHTGDENKQWSKGVNMNK